ncbi:MAG: hypothetical protein KBC69_00380 [Candidatus Magasanikbacteria bacterium]|nr:hypothetical protein [Candidatus Magasanikbacteria bacterium]
MADEIARDGDHLVFTGVVDQQTGGQEVVLYHDDGTTHEAIVTKGDSHPGQDLQTLPCGEFPDMPNVRHVRLGTGHRGPAIVNCEAFRKGFELIQWRSREDAQRSDLSD